jgi:hypothetical protein
MFQDQHQYEIARRRQPQRQSKSQKDRMSPGSCHRFPMIQSQSLHNQVNVSYRRSAASGGP